MKKTALTILVTTLLASSAALAQPQPPAAPAAPDAAAASDTPSAPNPDEMAADLNRQQRVEQTYTLTRTLDGKVIETTKKTLVFKPGDSARESEAGLSPVEEMLESFRNEVLTRTEAYEEAKLDYAAADVNRDNRMTADEFAGLVENWRLSAIEKTGPTDDEETQQRRLRAFTGGLDPVKVSEDARAKFVLMAGATDAMTRKQYVRETMIDFDAMDGDRDRLLRGDELLKFRALNSGASTQGLGGPAKTEIPPLLKRQ